MKNKLNISKYILALLSLSLFISCEPEEIVEPDPVVVTPVTPVVPSTAKCHSKEECLSLNDSELLNVALGGGAGSCQAIYRGGTSNLISIFISGMPIKFNEQQHFVPTDRYDQGAVELVQDIAPLIRLAITNNECFWPISLSDYTMSQKTLKALQYVGNSYGKCQIIFRGGTSDKVSIKVDGIYIKVVNNNIFNAANNDQAAVKYIDEIAYDLEYIQKSNYCKI